MTARVVIVAMLAVAALAGAAMWWLQLYAFYREEGLKEAGPVRVALRGGGAEELAVTSFRAINSDSSPIRFRACFATDLDLPALAARAEPYPFATPLTAPGWFDCFDARAVGEGIEAGAFSPFRAVPDPSPGVARVLALSQDGRQGVLWNQIDPCGPLADPEEQPAACPPPSGAAP